MDNLKDRAQQGFEAGEFTVEDLPLIRNVRNIDEETLQYLDSIDPAYLQAPEAEPFDPEIFLEGFEDLEAEDAQTADVTPDASAEVQTNQEVDETEPFNSEQFLEGFETLGQEEFVPLAPSENTALADEAGYVNFANIQKGVDYQTLSDNKDWVYASSLMFETVHGVPIYDRKGVITPAVQKILDKYGDGEESTEALIANYGLKEMAGFNFNIVEMAIDAKNLYELDDKLDLEKKQAFLYLLEQYDEVNTSWKTTGDAAWEMVTDWTNWAGLLTLGAGTAVSYGAKKLTKEVTVEAIKATLRKGIHNSVAKVGLKTSGQRLTGLAVLEGGLHMGYYDKTLQNVENDIKSSYLGKDLEGEDYEDFKDEYMEEHYSLGQTAAMAGFGGVVGGGASVILNKTVGKVAQKRAEKKLKQIEENHKKAVMEQLEEAQKILDNAPKNTIARMLAEDKPLDEVLEFAEREARDMAAKQGEVVEEIIEEVDFVALKLPRGLAGSKPTYNYGSSNIKLNFEDDIAKALYIVGTKTKSKEYAKFVAFLQKAGIKDIKQQAAAMRASIKKQAADGADSVDVTYNKPKTVQKITQKVTQGNVVEEVPKVIKIKKGTWGIEGTDKVFKTKKAATEAATKISKNQDPRPYVDDNVNFFKDAADVIRRIMDNPAAASEIIENLNNQRLSMVQTEKFASMINEAYSLIQHKWLKTENDLLNKKLTKKQREEALKANQRALESMLKAKELKEEVNSYAGRTLQDIQNWVTYKTELGEAPTEAAIEKAHVKYYQAQIQKVIKKHQAAIDEAYNNKDFTKAIQLTNKRNNSNEMVMLFKGLEKYDPRLANKLSDKPSDNATFFEKYLEMSIAGYFSPTTVQYNTVVPFLKVLTMPLLDTLVQNPLSRAAWRKTLFQYAALKSAQKAAIRAAKMAQQLEHTPLTADPARFYDGGVKVKGHVAKHFRIFPRLVAFSDAYLQENVAASVLTSKHYDLLLEEGAKLGKKGKDLQKYIDDNIEARVAAGYDRSLNEQVVKPIIEAANNLNLKGTDKEKYILKTLNREGSTEAMKRLTDDEAVELINDMLYKKPFKRVFKEKGVHHWEYDWRENPIRRGAEVSEEYAAKWDDFVKHHPVLRLCTTIFWRTPVRLMNETMRLTPALNALMPKFVDDLGGVNGSIRKARAVTEAYTGYALIMFTINKYAENQITGGTGTDWSKKAQRSNNEEEMQALHVELFGKEVPYARLEPLRALMQFQVDVLEKHRIQSKRMAMGEGGGTDKELEDNMTKDMTILMATAIQVIKDTGLLTGAVETVESTGKILSAAQDEDDSVQASTEFWKLTFSKFSGVFPSSIKKGATALTGADELEAPANAWDRILTRIAPNDLSIPKQYGWDADVLRNESPMGSLIGFYPVQDTAPENKKSKDWHEVDAFIRKIEYLNLANVTRPYYRSRTYFGDVDMRTIDIPVQADRFLDANISLYDAIHREMSTLNKNSKYTNTLLKLSRSNAPLGTPKGQKKSELIQEVQKVFSKWREEAIFKVMRQHPDILNLHLEHKRRTEFSAIAN